MSRKTKKETPVKNVYDTLVELMKDADKKDGVVDANEDLYYKGASQRGISRETIESVHDYDMDYADAFHEVAGRQIIDLYGADDSLDETTHTAYLGRDNVVLTSARKRERNTENGLVTDHAPVTMMYVKGGNRGSERYKETEANLLSYASSLYNN